MKRQEKLVIRLSRGERQAIEKLAHLEKLPPSTYARRLLLQNAEMRGLVVPVRTEDAPARQPVPA